MQSGRAARVVNVSSKLHYMGSLRQHDINLQGPGVYTSLAAYAQSKLAQVRGTHLGGGGGGRRLAGCRKHAGDDATAPGMQREPAGLGLLPPAAAWLCIRRAWGMSHLAL